MQISLRTLEQGDVKKVTSSFSGESKGCWGGSACQLEKLKQNAAQDAPKKEVQSRARLWSHAKQWDRGWEDSGTWSPTMLRPNSQFSLIFQLGTTVPGFHFLDCQSRITDIAVAQRELKIRDWGRQHPEGRGKWERGFLEVYRACLGDPTCIEVLLERTFLERLLSDFIYKPGCNIVLSES